MSDPFRIAALVEARDSATDDLARAEARLSIAKGKARSTTQRIAGVLRMVGSGRTDAVCEAVVKLSIALAVKGRAKDNQESRTAVLGALDAVSRCLARGAASGDGAFEAVAGDVAEARRRIYQAACTDGISRSDLDAEEPH